MSRIIFITSEQPILLEKYGIQLIESNDYLKKYYPCLSNRKYVYDFEGFNNSISYKNFVKYLTNEAKNNEISILVLWETDNIEEINNYNTYIQHKNLINITNTSKLYELIYGLEYNNLKPSTEYEIATDFKL